MIVFRNVLVFLILIVSPYSFINSEEYPVSILNFYAKMFAGILNPTETVEEISPDLQGILKTKSYQNHYEEMQKNWNDVEKNRFLAIQQWVQSEISDTCNGNTVFYPFSGPDILTVLQFYTCGKQFILFGLEPPGQLRWMDKENEKDLNRYLYYIRSSLHSVIKYSFFRTNDMKIDFFSKLDGITPVLLAFLSYSKNDIVKISKIYLASDGNFTEKEIQGIKGVQIFYKENNKDIIKEVIYFQIDISDANLSKHKFFLDWLKKKGHFNTFIKSASYLMHRDTFSIIRNVILNQSEVVIQDDSGIPLRFFDSKNWNLSFYGSYIEPISLFKSRYQPNLRKIYAEGKVKPLPFGYGYQYQPSQSNLMVARKINKVNN